MPERILPDIFGERGQYPMATHAIAHPATLESALHCASPYAYVSARYNAAGWWSWHRVLCQLERFEATGEPQPGLPLRVQRHGAALGFLIGLLVHRLGVVAEPGWPEPTEA